MSFLTQIIKNLRLPQIARSNFHSLAVASAPKFNETTIITSEWSLLPARTNIRNHFPKPKEVKRIKVHGWEKRMATLEGRRVLMRRILKGRHVLSH